PRFEPDLCPPAIVSAEMVAVTPLSTVNTLKSDDVPPTETVSNAAPRPAMVKLELISKPLESAIEPVRPAAKLTVWLPPSVAALASAWRRVVSPGVGESASVLTTRLSDSVLVRENDTGEASVVATVTAYGPPGMPLAVAVTDAVPDVIVTGPEELSVAEAPLPGTVNVTTPPSTGSPGFFGVTVTCSGLGNAVLIPVAWLLPDETARVKPDDSKAPMSTAAPTTRGMPRWSVVKGLPWASTASAAFPASMAGLPGSRGRV